MSPNTLGFKGEEYACKLLLNNGHKILERNFRCTFGEIDIIATQRDKLVFVEVKTRKSTKYGMPEEAVTPYKIRKIGRVGELYSKLHPFLSKKIRIDVVSLLVINNVVTRVKIIQVV